MNKSELKATLKRVESLDQELQIVNMKIERLESCIQAHGIRYDRDRVQTSPKDAVAEVMAEIDPLLDKREKLTHEITRAVAETSEIIDRLKDGNQCLVMHYRYTAGLPFEEIARRMSYSPQRVYQLHDNAMRWLLADMSKKHKH